MAAKRGTTSSWLLTDPFGSAASGVRPGTATITGRQAFTAFGLAASPGTGELAGQSLGYLGQYLDSVLGEWNLRARGYDPGSGRFTALDPVAVPAGMAFANGNSYAFNIPTVLQDIGGRWAECGPIGSVCDGANLIPILNEISKDLDDTGYLALYNSLTPDQVDDIGYDDMLYIHAEAANRLQHMRVCELNPGQCMEACPDEGYDRCQAGRAAQILGPFVAGQAGGLVVTGLLAKLCAPRGPELLAPRPIVPFRENAKSVSRVVLMAVGAMMGVRGRGVGEAVGAG